MGKVIAIIVGARPQFVKILPFTRAIKGKLKYKIIHTGQHYDYEMSELFFSELNIPKPDYNLGVGSGMHGEQTARMMIGMEKIFTRIKPGLVVAVGDTNSTLAASMVAVKMDIPIAHIESGLRSFNMTMPEEVNRIITDRVSSLLFCPTKNAVMNLKREGINGGVFMTGDIMADALKIALPLVKKNNGIFRKYNIKKEKYNLMTLHRNFNTDSEQGLTSLMEKLEMFDGEIVFPIHPRTRQTIKLFKLANKIKNHKNIKIVDPLGYIDFLSLLKHAALVITDSGGIQKEAYMMKVRCLTLRDETEWVETLKGKANRLAGRYGKDLKKIHLKKWKTKWNTNVFGAGKSAQKMVAKICKYLKGLK